MTESTPPTGRVLAIDDEPEILETYEAILGKQGIRLTKAETLDAGVRLAATRPFDVCLLDRNVGYELGTEAVPQLKDQAPGLRIIMATAHRDTEAAMEALKLGIDDYLVKPFSPEQLRIAVARQMEARRLSAKVAVLEHEAAPVPVADGELTSKSPAMQKVLAMARQVARTGANVLILGESGTGKNVLARAIHRWSPRHEAHCVTVNCPSLNAELLENELFGHRKGAFTGAQESSEGRVAQADGGTLFLDEIGDFPLSLQPKLLRFIQDKEYERVGDPVTRQADVRLVTATNRNLAALVESGEFRQDLFYRLNVVAITLPPLRERAEDVVDLARGFLARFARDYGCPAREFSDAAQQAIRAYAWPGNVRELQNVVERAVILCGDVRIEADQLSLGESEAGSAGNVRASIGADLTLEQLERQHIEAVLARADTLDQASRILGIDASTLYRKRKSFGLK
ncbi:MAG: sigma-54-dependent Fis family transcriptional regulator [Xanthomonadales bacterium]|nr:sigma-54-dependent Fis family transcriptional regulator [Xanthomonadales bacterium]